MPPSAKGTAAAGLGWDPIESRTVRAFNCRFTDFANFAEFESPQFDFQIRRSINRSDQFQIVAPWLYCALVLVPQPCKTERYSLPIGQPGLPSQPNEIRHLAVAGSTSKTQ